MIKQFPGLFQFLGGYFNQDWVVDHGTPEAVIATFRREAAPDVLRATCGELDQLIMMFDGGTSDAQVALDELGCYYMPATAGIQAIDWLKQVRDKLQCI